MNFFKPLFFLNIVLFCRISILLPMLLSINGYTQEGIVFEFGQIDIYVGGHRVENNSNSSRSDQLYFIEGSYQVWSTQGSNNNRSVARFIIAEHDLN